jgi:hypothetical protein
MNLKKEDWSILEKLKFNITLTGIKYMIDPSEMIKRLEGKMALCEMLKKAQEREWGPV